MGNGLLVGLCFILAGLYDLNRVWRLRRTLAKAHEWPTTEGSVVRSDLIREPSGVWSGEVEYEYQVYGQPFVGGLVNIDGETRVGFTDKYAKRKVERFPVGSTVVVHFDPDSPETSFLETSPSSSLKLWSWIGIACLAIGTLILGIGASQP